jgi:hypothetical protein
MYSVMSAVLARMSNDHVLVRYVSVCQVRPTLNHVITEPTASSASWQEAQGLHDVCCSYVYCILYRAGPQFV